MLHYTSIAKDIQIAKSFNAEASKIKDWRLLRKIDRQMKEAARKLNEGRGYYLGTISQIRENHPGHGPSVAQEDGRTYMWAYHPGIPDRYGRVRISLVPVHQF